MSRYRGPRFKRTIYSIADISGTNWNSFINRFFLPFELISIILLVALIGAIS